MPRPAAALLCGVSFSGSDSCFEPFEKFPERDSVVGAQVGKRRDRDVPASGFDPADVSCKEKEAHKSEQQAVVHAPENVTAEEQEKQRYNIRMTEEIYSSIFKID